MWSVPSRRRLASTPARMCLRDSPRSLGPAPVAPKTLVAITRSSRSRPLSQRPRIDSDAPALYTSAVSMKVPPASTKPSRMRTEVSSSVGPPKCIAPRHNSLTFRPVRPMYRYSMPGDAMPSSALEGNLSRVSRWIGRTARVVQVYVGVRARVRRYRRRERGEDESERGDQGSGDSVHDHLRREARTDAALGSPVFGRAARSGQDRGVEVGLLGELRVRRDGEPVALPGSRLRELLALLALHAGRPVDAGTLVDALWPQVRP